MTASSKILVECSSGLARITLNDPERRNVLTAAMCNNFCLAVTAADSDPNVRLITIAAAGPAFCAGGDLKAMQQKTDLFSGSDALTIAESYRSTIQQIPLTLLKTTKPTIALIDGPAIGAGFDLACFCDLRVATTKARFAESFGHLGLISGIGGAFALTRLVGVGYAVAADLALTGRSVGASEAMQLGLINRLCEPQDLQKVADEISAAIISQPQSAVAGAKKLLRQSYQGTLEDHLNLAGFLQGALHQSTEHRQRVALALGTKTQK
jgi:enoyl-CoA hydratase/carnithine racemase